MNTDKLKGILEFGRENPSLEFKESQNWEDLKFKIVRSVLAMSNTRNGGYLIVGVKNDGSLTGMEKSHIDTFNEEEIKDFISNYSDPYVDFDLDKVTLEEKHYSVFTILEFSSVPVICKKAYEPDLRRGAVYVRTRTRRPESTAVGDFVHMRELIDLSVDKTNNDLRSRGWENKNQKNDREKFKQEFSDLNI